MISALYARVAAYIGLSTQRADDEIGELIAEAVAEAEAEAFQHRFLDDADYHCPPPRSLPRHAADFRPGVRNGWREDIDGVGLYRDPELQDLADLTRAQGSPWRAAQLMDWGR